MRKPQPFTFDAEGGEKRHAPATQRNRDAICDILRDTLPGQGRMLEIASGTGEHIVHFAQQFPALSWQPSDVDPAALESITAWLTDIRPGNVSPPVSLDVLGKWPDLAADAILCINMLHISPPAAAQGLFSGAARMLAKGAPLYIYGPFIQAGVQTAASNLAFDQSLKSRDAEWGLRHLDEVEATAKIAGFALAKTIAMPANNLSLIFRRN